jgi:hypothetical protein
MCAVKAFFLIFILLCWRPDEARADLIGHARALLAQLNPIDIAPKGLIGEAAGALDDVLQKSLSICAASSKWRSRS